MTNTQEINHADRGLIPAYPFSAHRSVVYGDYYIEKHRYHTKRNAIIEIWDVLNLSQRLKQRKAIAMSVGSQNNIINN